MPINVFDCFLVAFLITGLVRGRKHGFSTEFLLVLKWLTLLFVCALAYRPLGMLVNSAGFFDAWLALVVAYLGTALVILLLFAQFRTKFGRNLEGTDVFGRSEYYLGMASGLVRYSCILLVGLAFLHARTLTPEQARAREKHQVDIYGSTVFPTLNNVQEMVFRDSLTGSCIKEYLGFLLIDSTDSEEPAPMTARALVPTGATPRSQARPGQ